MFIVDVSKMKIKLMGYLILDVAYHFHTGRCIDYSIGNPYNRRVEN